MGEGVAFNIDDATIEKDVVAVAVCCLVVCQVYANSLRAACILEQVFESSSSLREPVLCCATVPIDEGVAFDIDDATVEKDVVAVAVCCLVVCQVYANSLRAACILELVVQSRVSR